MPPTPIFGFEQYADTEAVELDTLINGAVQSIEDGLPHRPVASLAALAALSGPLYPDGHYAVLTAASTGLAAGCTFVRAGSKWLFVSGRVTNLTTFVGALSSNVATMEGAAFYDMNDDLPKVFTSAAGAWRVTAPTPLRATVAKTTSLQNIRTTVDVVTFQTLVEGDSSFFTPASPNYITIPEDGRYLLSGQLRVNGGYVEIAFAFAVNGVINNYFLATAGDRSTVAWPTSKGQFEMELEAGDQVSMRANRYGGADKKITTHQTWMQVRKVA